MDPAKTCILAKDLALSFMVTTNLKKMNLIRYAIYSIY